MRKFIALKAIGILALLLSFGLVRGQSSSPAQQPKNAESALTPQNEAEILQNKEAWIAAHPDDYARLSGQKGTSPEEAAKMKAQEKEALYGNQSGQALRTEAAQPWGATENKEAWIASHPREYAEMNAGAAETRNQITRAEFNALPAAKQQAIAKDANHVIVNPTTQE